MMKIFPTNTAAKVAPLFIIETFAMAERALGLFLEDLPLIVQYTQMISRALLYLTKPTYRDDSRRLIGKLCRRNLLWVLLTQSK